MSKKPYAAFKLSEKTRSALQERFPPKFSEERCDHITIKFDTNDEADLFDPEKIEIIGYATDSVGIEALLVRIDNQIFRDDGDLWHITLSFEKGIKAPKELDVFHSAPADGQPDKRKSRNYFAGTSKALLMRALNPEHEDVVIEYLDAPLLIKVSPEISRKISVETPDNITKPSTHQLD